MRSPNAGTIALNFQGNQRLGSHLPGIDILVLAKVAHERQGFGEFKTTQIVFCVTYAVAATVSRDTARNLVCCAPAGDTAQGMTARNMKCTSASSASSGPSQACVENEW